MKRVPRSLMVYGDSGSTKTSQLYHVIKYLIKKLSAERGRPVRFRMIHSDGGGWAPFADSGMIERGEIELIDYSSRKFALADIRRLSMGYWPIWVDKDNHSHRDWAEDRVEYFKTENVCMTTEDEWEGIGGYLIEGMTSVAETLKTHISNQDEGVGFKESWKYTEEDFTVTGLTKGHYGIIQKEVYERHSRGFKTLPMAYLLYSALVGRGEDKQSKDKVYGPQLAGSAMTAVVPSWFMDVIHLEKISWNGNASPILPLENGGDGSHEAVVAWFIQHKDHVTVTPGLEGLEEKAGTYLVKARCMPELMPRLLEYFPYGFIPMGYKNGLDVYYKVLAKLTKEGTTT